MAHFVLITGKIGAGKSTVADLLRKKHYLVVDSDSRAKELYNDPEVYHKAVILLGKDILNADGSIDKNVLKGHVFTPDSRTEEFLSFLASRLLRDLNAEYRSSSEVVFVEAACTPQLPLLIIGLDIREALFVESSDAVRYDRLRKTRGMGDTDIERVEKVQRKTYESIFTWRADGLKVINLVNDGTAEELADALNDVLSEQLRLTDTEKFALYKRYLENGPGYCRDNAYCYAFYNMGGCSSCPFPCGRRQALFEKARRQALFERAESPGNL